MKHVHKYQLVPLSKDKTSKVYRCILPECTHFLRPDFVVGQRTICRFCGNEFIISKATIGSPKRRRKYLQCGCQNKSAQVVAAKVNEKSIEELLKELQ